MPEMLGIFLASVGVLFLVWLLLGAVVLRGQRGGVCFMDCTAGEGDRAERFLRCCAWLREMGILYMPVYLVDRGLLPEERENAEYIIARKSGLYLCRPEELGELLKEKEARKRGGAGPAAGDCNGDRISEP